ncbi:MAG TPA: AMP-binding protein, partial [Methylomicrobium sp.]|nr:AMP-binding protein [Methylomicrobium sp.]
MESHNSHPKLDTLPKVLRQRALEIGDRQVAMRAKDRGIWQSYTWKDYFEHVRDLCLGLTALGLQREDKVSVIGENKPQWYWAELAAQSAG